MIGWIEIFGERSYQQSRQQQNQRRRNEDFVPPLTFEPLPGGKWKIPNSMHALNSAQFQLDWKQKFCACRLTKNEEFLLSFREGGLTILASNLLEKRGKSVCCNSFQENVILRCSFSELKGLSRKVRREKLEACFPWNVQKIFSRFCAASGKICDALWQKSYFRAFEGALMKIVGKYIFW